MDNFKFSSLIETTTLSTEDKANLLKIFAAMKPERQLDIIENWWAYLDKILQIHGIAEDERKRQILETFKRINQIIDNAYLREQEKMKLEKLKKIQNDSDAIAIMDYDQKRKMAAIREKEKESMIAKEKLVDPLIFI